MTRGGYKLAKAKVIHFNVENEQIILSQMIKIIKVRRILVKDLSEETFIGKKHKVIFNTLAELTERNLEFNEDTFNQLSTGEYGGFEYIRKLQDLFDENENLEFHLERLKADSVKHKIKTDEISSFEELLENPVSGFEELKEQILKINDLVNIMSSTTKIMKGEDLLKKYQADLRIRQIDGIFVPTGIEELDAYLSEGFAKRKITVLAARPSMGKSTYVSNIIDKQRDMKKKVLVLPLETQSISVLDAMISRRTRIPLERLIKHPKLLTYEEKKQINKAAQDILLDGYLHWIDDRTITLNGLIPYLESGNYDLVVIDLFDKLADVETDQKVLTKKLNEVQILAQTYNVHFLLVSQIRRFAQMGKRGNDSVEKKPTLEMLKNSGAFEEVADTIVALYRKKYYFPDESDDILEQIILKQRRGVLNISVYNEFDGGTATVGKKSTPPSEERDESVF